MQATNEMEARIISSNENLKFGFKVVKLDDLETQGKQRLLIMTSHRILLYNIRQVERAVGKEESDILIHPELVKEAEGVYALSVWVLRRSKAQILNSTDIMICF